MNLILEILVVIHLVIGGFFLLVGSFGLVKLPDLMSRLHAPTKATTLGVGGTLIASMFYFFSVQGFLSIHEVLVTLFLFLTAPITAHFVAKAHLHSNQDLKIKLPSASKSGWKTFEDNSGPHSHSQ
jgi:multicomponent K+:H+ antiporter subunit G